MFCGTSYKERREEFEVSDAELIAMDLWEQRKLEALLKADVAPVKIQSWLGDFQHGLTIRITYPVPCITTLGAAPDEQEPSSREGMDSVPRRVREVYRAAEAASETRLLGWL